jgi:polyhydroxyalkanoate synthesis regulator phasin
MFDLFRKGYLVGLGLASLTREKVEEVVDDLVKRGEVAEKDRPRVVDDMLTRMRDEQKRLTNTLRETAQKVIVEMGIPSRQQFDELLKRVERLEQAAHSRKTTVKNDPTA